MSFTKIEMLALCKSVDELIKDNDIDPEFVIQWMVDEGLVDIEEYFEEEEEDE